MTEGKIKSIFREKLLSIAFLLFLILFVPFFTMDLSLGLDQKMILTGADMDCFFWIGA